ncbi:MAG: DUF4301 family protein, partial [Paludibacteraceae bacterium]|nr:DUF4301 family protein [Paludibacteraceae bacterium]
MYSEDDLIWLAENGITPESLEKQLQIFTKGVEPPAIKRIATCNDGIRVVNDAEVEMYQTAWNDYIENNPDKTTHFIPASGTANRLFRALYR